MRVNSLPPVTNNIEGGTLNLGISGANITLGAVFAGTIDFNVKDEAITFKGSADITVPKLAAGTLNLERAEDGTISGKSTVNLELPKNFSGSMDVTWDGREVTGLGKAAYQGEKLSGEVTLNLMEREKANQLKRDKQAPPADEKASTQATAASAPTNAKPKAKGKDKVNYAIFGEGDLTFAFTDWLNGTAHAIVDPEGFVTIIGKITPQKEFELFAQKDYDKELFKVEARAAYGIPVVGNIFIFANIGLGAFAKLGPGKFYNIQVDGTYSTDPKELQNFSIRGTFNVSAAAGLKLRGEAGVGLEILAHDIKAGAGINAIAGIKAYSEATPIIGYREKAKPGEDKKGEFFIRGELEIAAQPFLGLSGDLFVAVESPWWSPLPSKKWTWPLGGKEWPIGGSFGMLASVDYVFGSKEYPKIDFKPVDFSADKFMTDLYSDKAQPKGKEGAEQKGEWKEKNSKGAEAPKGSKGSLTPGKPAGPQPTAKSKVQSGTGKGSDKAVDPNAKTHEGKTVKQLQDEAGKKGKKPDGKDLRRARKRVNIRIRGKNNRPVSSLHSPLRMASP